MIKQIALEMLVPLQVAPTLLIEDVSSVGSCPHRHDTKFQIIIGVDVSGLCVNGS